MIRQIDCSGLIPAAEVVRASFATVAAEFGLTKDNFPTYTGFVTTAERLQEHLSRGWLMFGYYADGRLAGYVSLSRETEAAYELHNLAVLPEYRHLGYGGRLLDFCKEKVKELGGSKIVIGITEENTVLKNWYSRHGFIHTGARKFEHMPVTAGFMEFYIA